MIMRVIGTAFLDLHLTQNIQLQIPALNTRFSQQPFIAARLLPSTLTLEMSLT